jgi:hypothetical protein
MSLKQLFVRTLIAAHSKATRQATTQIDAAMANKQSQGKNKCSSSFSLTLQSRPPKAPLESLFAIRAPLSGVVNHQGRRLSR